MHHGASLHCVGYISEIGHQDECIIARSSDLVSRLDDSRENPALEEISGGNPDLGAIRLPNNPGLRLFRTAQ